MGQDRAIQGMTRQLEAIEGRTGQLEASVGVTEYRSVGETEDNDSTAYG